MAKRDGIARARPGDRSTSVLHDHLQLAIPAGVTRISDGDLETSFILDEGSSGLSIECAERLATATRPESAVEMSAANDMSTPKPFVLEPLAVFERRSSRSAYVPRRRSIASRPTSSSPSTCVLPTRPSSTSASISKVTWRNSRPLARSWRERSRRRCDLASLLEG